MQVRELITRLGFEADTKAARKYEGAIKNVAKVARRAAVALGAVSGATTALVVQFSNASSETLAWSNRLGVASNRLQSLGFAAQQYQITNEALTDGLKELSLRTDEFTSTAAGPAQEAFERLGLTVEELNAVSGNTGELFDLVRGRVADIQDVAARQRIADELFGGQAGEQFSEFLQISGDELERLENLAGTVGAVVPREVLQRAREFSRETNTLQATVGGFGKILAAELLPAYSEFVERTQEFLQANADLIQQNIRRFVDGLVFSLRILISIVGDVVSIVNGAAQAIGGWERAISLLVSAFVTLAGLRLVKFIGSIARVLFSARTGAVLLAGAMAALAKTPLIAAFIALVFIAEDLLFWLNGQDSAIGRLIGSYDDFIKKVSEVADKFGPEIEVMKRQMRGLGNVIAGALTFDGERLLQGLFDLVDPMFQAGEELGRMLLNGLIDGVGGFFADLFLGKKTGSGMRQSDEQRFSGLLDPNAENEEFDEAVRRATPGPVPEQATERVDLERDRDIRDAARSVLEATQMINALNAGDQSDIANQQSVTTSSNRSVNVSADVSLQVPQGTSEQQQAALEQQTRELFDQEMDRIIYNSLWDFQVQE